ncbi:MAG: AAA family ATPase [Chitinophagaceae bacterium]|nr:AAA family ATPase [Chitinophagaceae bacterium]
MRDNFYVITGGPGAGKTTLLETLSKYNVICVPEVARQIIREQVEQGGGALPWDDVVQYKDLMLQRSIEDYLRIDTFLPVFFDRGIPDTLAYARLIGHPLPAGIAEQYRCNKNVFILPPWEEIYRTDSERKQTFREAIDVCRRLEDEYAGHGYNIIEVPQVSAEERARFVLRQIHYVF